MTTNSVSKEQIEALIAGLEGVTPGPWMAQEADRGHDDPEYSEWGVSIIGLQTNNGVPYHSPTNGQIAYATMFPTEVDEGNAMRAEAHAAHIARCDPDTMRSILTELLSLRASSGGVTSGGLVTDEMVERALSGLWRGQGLGWNQHQCMRAALTAALSPLHAQPDWSDPEELDRVEVEVKALLAEPQGTGSREAVAKAWILVLEGGAEGSMFRDKEQAEAVCSGFTGAHLEPLVPLSQLHAVERESAALISRNAVLASDGIAARKAAGNNFTRAETAEDSLAAMTAERDAAREALKPFAECCPKSENLWRDDESWAAQVTVGDVRAARAALAGSNPK